MFNYSFGLISLDSEGNIEIGKTASISELYYAFSDGEVISSFMV